MQELGMHPETRERLAGERFRLRNFVFMMRKNQVDAAGMDIERLAQVLDGHHGALDVPAGPAGADGGVPEWSRPPWAPSRARNRARRPSRIRPHPRARRPCCR